MAAGNTQQALYRKWRPKTWEAVVGQEHIVQTLRNALAAERTAHAYLFAGPRGTGKTTTARLLAKAMNCLSEEVPARPCGKCEHCQAVQAGRFMDMIEIDAASNTSVEDVRDLRDKINFAPNQGRYKVYIIDEVHMLSTAAFNALLKTLEEPPPHAIFILATTEVHKIPATVLSRCQRHEFRRIPVNEIVHYLQEMAAEENIEVEPEALALVARQSTGAMRDAISLLDQLASTGQRITQEMAHNVLGTATSQSVLEVLDAVIEREPGKALDSIHRTLDNGSDPRQFARQIVEYLRGLMLVRMGKADLVEATTEGRLQMSRHAQKFSLSELLRNIKVFNSAATDTRSGWQPALPLEMAVLEAVEGPEAEAQAVPESTAARMASRPEPRATGPSAVRPGVVSPKRPVQEEAAEQPAPELEGEPEVSEDGEFTLQMLKEHWKGITAALRQRSPTAEALLKSGRVLGIKNGTLFLGFSEVLRDKMEKSGHEELVRQALQQALGREVGIRCVTYTGKAGGIPPDVDSDGMVAAALRDLGGELVDVQ